MSDVIKAFKGGPETVFSQEDGGQVITVTAKHLRPSDVQNNDAACTIIGWGGVILAGYLASQGAGEGALWSLGAGILFGTVMKVWHRQDGHEKTTIRFTEKQIQIQRPPKFIEKVECETFDRRLPHRFMVVEHDRAREERDDIEFSIRTHPGKRIVRYYTDAWIVVLEYLGQRFDIAEVMGARDARAIMERLALCDEYMNALHGTGSRVAVEPAQEWSPPTSPLPR